VAGGLTWGKKNGSIEKPGLQTIGHAGVATLAIRNVRLRHETSRSKLEFELWLMGKPFCTATFSIWRKETRLILEKI
jgi:hypothetical protein